jgi:acetyl/propionyl-CoA carboxylase alpha subunit
MVSRLLVANRGEIAIRIMRTAAELGIETVAVCSEDDGDSLHTRRADQLHQLRGKGAAAYLDIAQLVAAARELGCDAVHPGYGFASENPAFARACREAGITFVGPTEEALAVFGDKTRALGLARECGVPVLRATPAGLSEEHARNFFRSLGGGAAMFIKATAGGGGRGTRLVQAEEEIDEAFARCRSEATQAFGNGDLYAEQAMLRARHVEVQVVGDGLGGVSHLWDRDCSMQRRFQKVLEIAPSPRLSHAMRERLAADAVAMARAAGYRSCGTFEFLVDAAAAGGDARYAFIEANARLQVEHTVTEEVLDLDLVRVQLLIAGGKSLADLGLEQAQVPEPRGYAIQARINMETMNADGSVRPGGGRLSAFEAPAGRGIRVDSSGYAGYRPNPGFDSLLAKLICHSPIAAFEEAVAKTARALSEFRVEGVATNLAFLQALLEHPNFREQRTHTRFIEEQLGELVRPEAQARRKLYFEQAGARPRAGAVLKDTDPLAVLDYGRGGAPALAPSFDPEDNGASEWSFDSAGMEGMLAVPVPVQATVVSVDVREGEAVHKGRQLVVVNSMKMEHVISAPAGGVVMRVTVAPGDTVPEGTPLVFLQEQDLDESASGEASAVDLDTLRPDLAEVERRRKLTLDSARPKSVEARHALGSRTARENVEDLCDPGTFMEYGQVAIATGLRGTLEERLQYAPSDGLVMGVGHVNGHLFDEQRSRVAVVAYDATVLAGTQGGMNHKKKDRMFQVAEQLRLPLILFAEGGGGRAGSGSRNARVTDTEIRGGGGLNTSSFYLLAKLSGLVPMVGVVNRRCFAGNAALLGMCDVIIATASSTIGMGGPAMIEGGGLGVYRPEEVGPMPVQVPNGVVDIAVADEAEAVAAAKQYLSYFQGTVPPGECADQRLLRQIIPENRLRVYDVRQLIETLADTGSVLELRRGFGLAMVTAFIRIAGRPVGVIANNPLHLSGAIDSPAADKGARFMKLCDAFDIPLVFLCDTPGIMVGPEVEKTAVVRHSARMFVVGANISVPTFMVIIRKSYGLGAQAMGGGAQNLPALTVAWPTAEFGGMGLEGQVKLGHRRELEAEEDPEARRALYEKMVAAAYERGKALNAAHVYEIDDVIDPADTRRWLIAGLEAAPPVEPRTGKKRACVDVW